MRQLVAAFLDIPVLHSRFPIYYLAVDKQRQQFLSETEDFLEQIFAATDQLREDVTPQLQRELIDQIFRHVHRLKGSAASLGIVGLAEIAHEFEHLFNVMRSERVAVSIIRSFRSTLHHAQPSSLKA